MDLRKTIGFTFSYLLCCFNLIGQHSLEGTVLNQDRETLQGATVVVLDQDSTMILFGITNENGYFKFHDMSQGEYILQLSYLSYSNMSRSCIISGDNHIVNIGNILMTKSNEVLQEVTIKAEHIPMGLVGDTISYNTAAFKTKPGATVQDLLKKLPGIEVQRDGSIKAQGEDVENVLVDGKEFFGNDPTIATQNLEAEAVDKVQVFDKQSDIAEFTGIEDGQDEKTINLKLKEDYKSGGFGNIQIEGGTEERYESKFNYNRFNANMQTSAIMSSNNINKQAFSFNEYISLMGGLNAAMSGNFNEFSFNEFGQSKTPRGITDNFTGGLNFNYDFNKNLSLTSNYFYLKSDKLTDQTSIGNQFLDRQTFSSIDTSNSENNRQQHRIRSKLIYKKNPFTEIELKNNVGLSSSDRLLNGSSIFQTFNGLNKTRSLNQVNNSGFDYNGSLQLRKKFGKKSRNWINDLKYSTRRNEENSQLNNRFNIIGRMSSLEQQQFYDSEESDLQLLTKFTEPIGKGYYLGIQHSFHQNRESPLKEFFDVSNNQLRLNEDLSAGFVKTLSYHTTGISLKRNRKKSKLTLAIDHQLTQLNVISYQTDEPIKNRFNHVLPNVYFDWDISNSKSLSINYNTSITAPQLQQLIPIPNNLNPNVLITGNPNLRPFDSHTAQITFNVFDNFNFRNLFANIQFSLIKDQIVNQVNIDNNLLRTITPINSDNYFRAFSYLSFSEPIRALKLKYRISSQAFYTNYLSFLNNIESQVSESNTFISIALENRKIDVINISAGVKVDYSTRSYEINESFNQRYFNYTLFVDGTYQINDGLLIKSTFDMVNYSEEDFSAVQDFILWNATIEKSFNTNKFSIYLSVFDILGQNTGIERFGGFNSITDTRFNTLSRYVSCGMRYRIGKNSKERYSN